MTRSIRRRRTQQENLDKLKKWMQRRGRSPTLDEIQRIIDRGYSSAGKYKRMLKEIEQDKKTR